MKIAGCSPKHFLLKYLLFCGLFAGILILLIWISTFLLSDQEHNRFSPTDAKKDSLPVIVIDAGHGGEDGGAIGVDGTLEKDVNLHIAMQLNDILQSMGYKTVMTRTEDILLYDKNSDYHGQKKVQDLATRKRITEQYDNVVFVSIHMNAFPNEKYHGMQVYYSTNNTQSQLLANAIQSLTTNALQSDNTRKIKPTNGNIYLLDRLQCPAVLVECGFLSNREECARLADESYQKKMAFALAFAITQYFSDSGS